MRLNQILDRLSRVGCHLYLSQDENNRIILSNQVALFFILPPLPYLVTFLWLKQYLLSIWVPFVVFSYVGLTLGLNRFGYYTGAKFSLIFIPVSAAFFYGIVLGANTGMGALFLSLSVLAAVLFHPKETWKIVLALAITSFGGLGMQLGTIYIQPWVILSPQVKACLILISTTTSFSMLFFCVRFYFNIYSRHAQLLKERMNRIQEHSERCASLKDWEDQCLEIFQNEFKTDIVLACRTEKIPNIEKKYLELWVDKNGLAFEHLLKISGTQGWNELGVSLLIPFYSGSGILGLIGLKPSYPFSEDELELLRFAKRELQAVFVMLQSLGKSKEINFSDFTSKNEALLLEKNITARELEIISMLLRGYSNSKISAALFISESTTKRHVYNIFRKLEIGSRFELIRWVGA